MSSKYVTQCPPTEREGVSLRPSRAELWGPRAVGRLCLRSLGTSVTHGALSFWQRTMGEGLAVLACVPQGT